MENILKKKRLEKKLTLEEVGNMVGVGKSTVRKWETGMIENMRRDNIVALSKALDISPLEILGIEKYDTSIETIYNQLNERRQIRVYNFAEEQLEEQNRKVVPLLGKTAANPTEISYGDPVHDEQVKSNVPKNADCALVVQGDSMEPDFPNGTIVFYRSQKEVENGELAIVEIEGQGVTFKKFYRDFLNEKIVLKSLNKKYPDRELDGRQCRVLGKVVK